jgi:hypothetical protein
VPPCDDPEQVVAAGAKTSIGHALDDPVHVSATSHGPAAARHTAPAFPGAELHPVLAMQLSAVQGLLSSQTIDVPTHTPPWQLSIVGVHTSSPSLHAVPFAAPRHVTVNRP